MRQLVVLAALGVLNIGCGSALLQAAESGDLKGFRAELKARLAEGDVSTGEAQDVARTLMAREIDTAQAPTGVRTIEGVAECADELDGDLAARADREDEIAARALLLRMDNGKVSAMKYDELVSSKDDHWRAVAARSLTLPEPAPRGSEDEVRAARWRRKLMADPSTLVRLSALRSAVEAADKGDVDDVLAAARLDPDPEVRYAAMEAAGQIGTREAVLGLKDVWSGTDHDGKLAIVHAWAAAWRRPYKAGDDDIKCQVLDLHPSCEAWHQLQRASDEGSGMPALLASLELIHDVAPAQAQTAEGNAAAVVERLIDKAAPRVRVEAIGSAPMGWAHLLEAIVAASSDKEDEVAVAALARMLELEEKDREKALAKLRKLVMARGDAGDDAAMVLAKAGDKAALKRLELDAKSASRELRILAAEGFAALGDAGHALALLGDADTEVRARSACAIIKMDD